MPQGGARGKNLETFKKCFSTFLLWKQLMQIVSQTRLNLVTLTCGSESSLCAQWVAEDPSFLLADSEDSDQTGCTVILLVLS